MPGEPCWTWSDRGPEASARVRELMEPLGFDGGTTTVDDLLCEIRPLFERPCTHRVDGLFGRAASRESSGGRLRIRATRFPAHETLAEFDFTFTIASGHPGGWPEQRLLFRIAIEWIALLGEAQRRGKLDQELDRLERIRLLICDPDRRRTMPTGRGSRLTIAEGQSSVGFSISPVGLSARSWAFAERRQVGPTRDVRSVGVDAGCSSNIAQPCRRTCGLSFALWSDERRASRGAAVAWMATRRSMAS